MFGMLGVAKAQTQVIAEELNANEVQVTWGSNWSYVEDFETGDFSKFNWDNSISDFPWEICSERPYEGSYCMRSTNQGTLESVSAIQVVVEVPSDGYMSFYDRISSSAGFDCGRFFIDDVLMGLWSGESDWLKREYPITQGRHTLLWSYTKESDENYGDDTFWIDCIDFCHDPDPVGSSWLTYATPNYYGSVGSENGETQFGYRWPTSVLADYAGYALTKVGIFSDLEGYTGGEYTVSLHYGDPDDQYLPGSLVSSQTVNVPVGLGEYVEFDLDEPLVIDGDQIVWMIWHFSGTVNDRPAPACNEMDYNLDGEWFYDGGWVSLFYGAWMIEGYALAPEGSEVRLGIADNGQSSRNVSSFNVYRRKGSEMPELLVSQVTDTLYLDAEWATLEDGSYQWGVSIDDGTTIVWSNSIVKDMTDLTEMGDWVVLYPNPSRGKVTVSGQGIRRVTVLSLQGQVVYDMEAEADSTTIDLSSLDSGLYLVRLSTVDGSITKRVEVLK